jgi:DNA replication and repair protein RecF
MFVTALSLRNFRNYARLDIQLGPGINLFYGDNAKGKTNLLEAVFFLGSLRSFRGARTAELVRWGEREAGVTGRVNPGDGPGDGPGAAVGRATALAAGISDGKRRVTVDGKSPRGPADYLGTLKVSSFSPEDLFLVKEYPSHRRRFLDRSIFHLRPGYMGLAQEYRRALGQLNAALRTGDDGHVAAWEGVIAPLAAGITMQRRTQAELLSKRAALVYERITGGGGLGASYRSAVRGDTKTELAAGYLDRMEQRRAEAKKRGYCQAGPHSEDLHITLDGRDIRASASRGQSRLAFLALVIADCELYRQERGSWPALLMDDAASELDRSRRESLMAYVSGMGQTLMTSTDGELLKMAAGTGYCVDGGTIRRCG